MKRKIDSWLTRLFAQDCLGKQRSKAETEQVQTAVIPDSLFAQTALGKQHQQTENQQNLSNLLTKSTRISTHSKHMGQLRNTCVHLSKLSYIFRKPRNKKTRMPFKNSRLNRKKESQTKKETWGSLFSYKKGCKPAKNTSWNSGDYPWIKTPTAEAAPAAAPLRQPFFLSFLVFFLFFYVSFSHEWLKPFC